MQPPGQQQQGYGHGHYGPPPPYGAPMPQPGSQGSLGTPPNSFQQQGGYSQPAQPTYPPSGFAPQQQPQQPLQQQQGMPHAGSYPQMAPQQQPPQQQQQAFFMPQQPFMPSQPQQQYNSMPPNYGAHQQQPAAMPQAGVDMGIPGFGAAAGGGGGGGGGFMSNLSPINLMTGGLFAAPQQYMQQRVSWFKTNMTGGTMSALFNISNHYVGNKLLMLFFPFLRKWTYARMHEQIAGGQRYRPPAVDVNAPDLFIPLMGLWSYALLSCVVLAFKHAFKPEMMSSTLYSACFAWGLHWLVARLLLKGMNVPGVAWSELLAYTGYPFVLICFTTLGGFLAGKWGYYALGAYGSLAMAIFMVKTMKRVIFQETRAYGTDMRLANYLLLALAAFQFPFSFLLAYRPM